jgi:hypothetical protein
MLLRWRNPRHLRRDEGKSLGSAVEKSVVPPAEAAFEAAFAGSRQSSARQLHQFRSRHL